MIIVALTIFEVSLVLFTLFEILQGARFHQLNASHLKYIVSFSEQVRQIQADKPINTLVLRKTMYDIREQPIECLKQITAVEKFIMRRIGTYNAIELCEKDIADANNGLALIDSYVDERINRKSFVMQLDILSGIFKQNSIDFELPIVRTVEFIVNLMVPIVIVLSITIVMFIVYLSRNITTSIKDVISLLSREQSDKALDDTISKNVTGELRELLISAKLRVKKEAIKTEVNRQLEALVSQRTESLTKANQELAEFAYRLSHDLKSPLTSSKGLARFVIQDIDDNHLHEARRNSQQIVTQMEKLEQLLSRVLSLTNEKLQTEEASFIDFDEVFDTIRRENQEVLRAHDCLLVCETHVQHALRSGRQSLILILGHLVSNSAKYSDPDKMCRSVKVAVFERECDYHIDIIDNGRGIPENRIPEVFLMFKRFHPNVGSGAGLGLATVKKYVGYLGGRIKFDTSADGTTFTIVLPKGDVM
jgi:signal transduction histidine kinase